MIFVVLGTQKFQFNRLLQKMDSLIEQGVITEEVTAQYGYSDYELKNIKGTDFMGGEDFQKCIADSDILVCHSGVGTIMTALRLGKPVVVVPRLAEYGEHVDDHQLQIAESFEESGYVICCTDTEKLGEYIERARTHKFSKYVSHREDMLNIINSYLESI